MTTLNETLFSTIVHDYHNGGVKSSYGLDSYTRKELLKFCSLVKIVIVLTV
jgi:hypothetical protein